MNDPFKQPAGAEGIIRMTGVNKWYGQFHVLKDINLNVRQGERIVLCGPSGSGKSTTIRCINRLEEHQQGSIVVDGVELTNDLKQIEAIRREVGMVFQHFNLWSHMTVLENVTMAPRRVLGVSKQEAETRARAYLDKVGLPARVADQYPAFLSGGQQQRVAIARALAMEPEVMLFDEPTSALDPELVGEVLKVIQGLAEEGRTMIMVTHEMAFARQVSSQVLFLHQGRVEEQGVPADVLGNPKSERLRQFLSGNLK